MSPSNADLQRFWGTLPQPERRSLLSVPKSRLFEALRSLGVCSRCFGFLQLHYEELKSPHASCSSEGCQVCAELWGPLSLTVSQGEVALTDSCVDDPFPALDKADEREAARRASSYSDVCGPGWSGRGRDLCSLHTLPLDQCTLEYYWRELAEPYQAAVTEIRVSACHSLGGREGSRLNRGAPPCVAGGGHAG